jgi:hypothetical protein
VDAGIKAASHNHSSVGISILAMWLIEKCSRRKLISLATVSHFGLYFPLDVELEALSLSTRSINVDILII